jgi:hypothetical protein
MKRGAAEHLPHIHQIRSARALNSILGDIELDLSRSFTFFDTYMDVLTQRNTPQLGPILAGCDVLASDAIKRTHPALTLIEPPIVFCDRGHGAAIIRESVSLPDGTLNPMPLIQIPYSRLKEKYNLTSILHEAGHQALTRLGLVSAIPKMIRSVLTQVGASDVIKDLFSLWAFEIGPDFWTFCGSGIAAAAGIKEILSLPPTQVLRLSWTDPHPPPYLRVLLSFEWCRQLWGQGNWNEWEREWTSLYTLESAPTKTKEVLKEGVTLLPAIGRAFLTARFQTLNGRKISDLFNLSALAPLKLQQVVVGADTGMLNLRGLSPCAQLAVFRLVKERGTLNERRLDDVMTTWLTKLGAGRHYLH